MKRIIAPTLLLVLFAALLVQLPIAIAGRVSVYDLIDPTIDVSSILLNEYVEEPDQKAMQEAMIEAMIDTLDDPYTLFVPPANVAEFTKQLRGTYVGIGAEVNIVDGYLTITTPMDDSPALRAGVLAGDTVLEIGGVSTFERPINECIDLLMGEPGTEVTFKVRHLDGEEEDIVVVRERIVTRTVRGLRRHGADWNHCVDEALGISYIRITQFNASTVTELSAAIDDLKSNGLNGLVLDLRDNPGGALPAAVGVSDLFLAEGDVVTVRPREGEDATYSASAADTLPDFPMVILVNGDSASASEIVAGALQDNGRARVLGTRSYGKGSVQEVRPLDYGRGTLKFTTAYYYLPNGRNLHRRTESETWGVDPAPGLVVPATPDERVAAWRARRDYEVIREPNAESAACVDAGWIREELLDEQLASAVEVLQARLRGEDWPQLTDLDAGELAFNEELDSHMKRRTRILEELHRTEDRIARLEGQSGAEPAPLLPTDVDLEEGTLTLRDRHDNVIGTYRIEGGDVSLALQTVTLTPIEDDARDPGE
jgi:carboxyl-terminal processing protease